VTRRQSGISTRRGRKREVGEDTNYYARSVAPNICRIFDYSASVTAEYSVFGQWPNRLFVVSLEIMEIPKVCQTFICKLFSKVKKVEVNTNWIAEINSELDIFVTFSMYIHLLLTLSMAKSNDIFVKSETTSNDIKTLLFEISFPDNMLYNLKLFLIWLLARDKLLSKILCRNVANE